MKTPRLFHLGLLALVLLPGGLFAQGFQSGSSGSYGPINVSAGDATLDLPPDGVFHCTTINVASGRTLRFRRNALNTPVFLLATGEVTVTGVIDVSGGRGSSTTAGIGGPGGFDGGPPGNAGLPAGDGLGPGGGRAGALESGATGPGGAGHAAQSTASPTDKRGAVYGSPLLLPPTGGSGGGGAAGLPGWGGGGGGGALVIASSSRILVNGVVRAHGGQGHSSGFLNTGSGGSVRLVAPLVTGTGTVAAQGDGGVGGRGDGWVRVDATDRSALAGLRLLPESSSSVGGLMAVFPDPLPRLDIIEASGRAIPLDSGPVQVLLPAGSPATQTVKVRAQGFNQVVPIRVVLTPDSGPSQSYDAEINNTGVNPAEVTINVSFPANVQTHVHVWTR